MRYLLTLLAILWLCTTLNAQVLIGNQAHEKIKGAEVIRMNKATNMPEYVSLRPEARFDVSQLERWVRHHYLLPAEVSFAVRSVEKDTKGHQHIRYNQLFKGLVVEGAMLIAHTENGKVYALNGEVFNNLPSAQVSFTEAAALQAALNKIGAAVYRWQIPGAEMQLKASTGSPAATWYPKGQLVYAPVGDLKHPEYRAAWKFDVYAVQPLGRNYVFVDVATGEVLRMFSRIHHGNSTGTAQTKYSGTQTIITDSYSGGYKLEETTRGNGVATYNLQNGMDPWSAVDFTDADNNWNNVNSNQDEVATDAHFATEKTYDYFFNKFNRNSIDDAGLQLVSMLHYDVDYVNAFWDGSVMTYGDGDGVTYTPLTTLDICGHEITHGLTQYTAELYYEAESGALNESFSDIFGAAIEFYVRGGQGNWLIAEDCDPRGYGFRNMEDPNLYEYPDTYDGDYWTFVGPGCDVSDDNCGVHNNSSVQNHWFYLLVTGGSGTNDNGDNYSVTGIGLSAAEAIAYRTLTIYLTSTSDFADARFYSLEAAEDLYGACSNAYIQTGNAWYAVGVGLPITPTAQADFESPAIHCNRSVPVQFTNLSTGASTYLWSFGDGTTSTQMNPTHTYAANGTYTISLIVTGCNNTRDTLVRNNYITIDPTSPFCSIINMPNGQGQSTACSGRLYDSGGALNNYGPDENRVFTIRPTGATSVTLDFVSFNTEDGYDYLIIHEGTNTNGSILGMFAGNANVPNITSSTGAITLKFTSDEFIEDTGFELYWTCTAVALPPVAAIGNTLPSCSPTVSFNDVSTNFPTSWVWYFGDGTTSTQQNPSYTYTAPGTYQVILQATNSFGSTRDTFLLNISSLTPTFVSPDTVNLGQSVNLVNTTAGAVQSTFWSFGNGLTSNQTSPNVTFMHEGWTTVLLRVEDAQGCTYETTKQVYVRRLVGVDEVIQKSFVVYPNPFAAEVNVVFDAPLTEAGSIELYNMLGEMVYTQTYQRGTSSLVLDIAHLSGGVYLLKLDGHNGYAASRVVKY